MKPNPPPRGGRHERARENRAGLPSLVRTAAQKLASAETAAEVLDARDAASVAYDAAKSAARIARAKQAHDEIIGQFTGRRQTRWRLKARPSPALPMNMMRHRNAVK